MVRPAAVAAWPPAKPELWNDANIHGTYIKNDTGSGHWEWRDGFQPPDEFYVKIDSFTVKIRFTPFGHLGIFPEQLENWRRLTELGPQLQRLHAEPWALNLFAYSGLSTLACLAGGLSVTHLDSSKGMTDWARDNARASGLADRPVRWIVDDVVKFLKREVRRERRYRVLILDPPTFGRGSKGEVWKIERDLPELLDLLMELCDGRPDAVVLTCHSTGYTAETLARLLAGRFSAGHSGTFHTGELSIPESASGLGYPSGSSCVFTADGVG